MAQRYSNDDLDPVRAKIVSKVEELGLNLKSLSSALGLNETYLQQFVRKNVPKVLPMELRVKLASVLQVPVDALGGSAPEPKGSRPRGVPYLQHRRKPDAPQVQPRVRPPVVRGEPSFMNRGNLMPVFSCPGPFGEAWVTDWIERPAQYVGSGNAFAIWVPSCTARLRAGDLALVHPARPPNQGDAVVVTLPDQIVTVGELVRRSTTEAVALTAIGETTFPLSKHRLRRIALTVHQ